MCVDSEIWGIWEQGIIMGNKGQDSASQLLGVPDPGIIYPGRFFQWGGDLRSFQEPASHGMLFLAIIPCLALLITICLIKFINFYDGKIIV